MMAGLISFDMVNPKPLGVAGVTIAILIAVQPLTTTYMGVSMNIIGVVVVAVGGLLGGFADS